MARASWYTPLRARLPRRHHHLLLLLFFIELPPLPPPRPLSATIAPLVEKCNARTWCTGMSGTYHDLGTIAIKINITVPIHSLPSVSYCQSSLKYTT